MDKNFVPVHCGICGCEMGGGDSPLTLWKRVPTCAKCKKAVCIRCTSNKLGRLILRKLPICKKCAGIPEIVAQEKK